MDRHANERLVLVALDCLRDLGITLVYAILAGGLIVAVVASDTSQISVLHALVYAALLPIMVAMMIGYEIVASVLAEWRAGRRPAIPASRAAQQDPALRTREFGMNSC